MQKLKTDVIVIGAGLVGLALAKGLVRQGYRVALLEKRVLTDEFQRPPLFEQRGIVLSKTSCDLLEQQLGYSELLKGASEIQTVHVSERGHFSKLRFHAKQAQEPYLAKVKKAFELAHSLYQQTKNESLLQEFSGIEVMQIDAEQGLVTFKQGEQIYQLESELVVASDGAHSQTMKLLELPQKQVDYEQVALICNLKISGDHDAVAYERFLPEGPLAFLPVGEQEVAMVWCMQPERAQMFLSSDDNTLYQALYKNFGHRMGRFVEHSPLHSHPMKSSHALKQSKGKVLVFGNAAHTLHPVAGQGFNLSVRDIVALLRLIQQHGLTESMLSRYLAERAPGQQSMRLVSDVLPRAFSQRYRPFKLLQAVAFTACDRLPFVNQHLMARFLGKRDHQPMLLAGVFHE